MLVLTESLRLLQCYGASERLPQQTTRSGCSKWYARNDLVSLPTQITR
jgi:hypothetical protein